MANEPSDPNSPSPSDPSEVTPVPEDIKIMLRRAGFDTSDPTVIKILLEASLTKFQGSLDFPPAQILHGWEEVYPGITAKLVEWRERQTTHRLRLESLQTEKAEDRADTGQFITAILAVLGIALASLLTLQGHPWSGGLLMILSIGGPTAAVILAGRFSGP